MTTYTVCRSDEVALGEKKVFTAASQKILVYHLSDGFFATQSNCTHLFAPLAKGKILADCKVQCPFHRASFDIRTGAVVDWANFPPGIQMLNAVRGKKDLRTFKVAVKNGSVEVDIPDA